jgi:hypothetical protein
MAYEVKRATDSERLLAANREIARLRAVLSELGALLQRERRAVSAPAMPEPPEPSEPSEPLEPPDAPDAPDPVIKLVAVIINRKYQTVMLYPDNETARILAEIAKLRTFPPRVIELVKRLGYRIETREQAAEDKSIEDRSAEAGELPEAELPEQGRSE